MNQAVADQLQKAQSLLQLWKAYSNAHGEATARLKQQEAKFQQLANISMSGNNLAEILPPALQDIKVGTKSIWKTKAKSAQQTGPVRDGHDLGTRQTTGTEKSVRTDAVSRPCRTQARLGRPGGSSEVTSRQQIVG